MMNLDDFEMNLDRIIVDKKIHSMIRLLAVEIQRNPYITVGEWLKSMNDDECESLCDHLVESDSADSMSDLILLGIMLTRTESVFIETDSDLAQAASKMRMFLSISSLHRKGFVRARYENMSFGEDADKLIIAEKIDE